MSILLETKRLLLRHFELTDTQFIIALLNTKEWIRYIGDRQVLTEEAAQQYLLNGPIKSYAVNGFGLSLVALKDTFEPIGMCGLIKRESLDDIDIGFAFMPEYFGKGFAYEIASATLTYAKNKLQLKRVIAICLAENHRSIKLLEKTGMKYESKAIVGEEELLQYGISF